MLTVFKNTANAFWQMMGGYPYTRTLWCFPLIPGGGGLGGASSSPLGAFSSTVGRQRAGVGTDAVLHASAYGMHPPPLGGVRTSYVAVEAADTVGELGVPALVWAAHKAAEKEEADAS